MGIHAALKRGARPAYDKHGEVGANVVLVTASNLGLSPERYGARGLNGELGAFGTT